MLGRPWDDEASRIFLLLTDDCQELGIATSTPTLELPTAWNPAGACTDDAEDEEPYDDGDEEPYADGDPPVDGWDAGDPPCDGPLDGWDPCGPPPPNRPLLLLDELHAETAIVRPTTAATAAGTGLFMYTPLFINYCTARGAGYSNMADFALNR
ncbi:MAG: hypothetical protein J2P25_12340 [Nocardiopsaceae bacterium]|nr:hypothetical protein [Nocardiopsaceae bacterium]